MFKVSTLASRSNSDSPSFISWCHTPIEELVHEPTHPLIEILRQKKCWELPCNSGASSLSTSSLKSLGVPKGSTLQFSDLETFGPNVFTRG